MVYRRIDKHMFVGAWYTKNTVSWHLKPYSYHFNSEDAATKVYENCHLHKLPAQLSILESA